MTRLRGRQRHPWLRIWGGPMYSILETSPQPAAWRCTFRCGCGCLVSSAGRTSTSRSCADLLMYLCGKLGRGRLLIYRRLGVANEACQHHSANADHSSHAEGELDAAIERGKVWQPGLGQGGCSAG